MPLSWQTTEHKAFFDKHIYSYCSHFETGTLKEFWTKTSKAWFETWPPAEVPEDLIKEKGTVEKADRAWRRSNFEVSNIH